MRAAAGREAATARRRIRSDDRHRLLGVGAGPPRVAESPVAGGHREADRTDGETALADEREPVGERFEIGEMAAQEAVVADPGRGVTAAVVSGESQPVVGERAVEPGQRGAGFVAASPFAPGSTPPASGSARRMATRGARRDGQRRVDLTGLRLRPRRGCWPGCCRRCSAEPAAAPGRRASAWPRARLEVAVEHGESGFGELQVAPTGRGAHGMGQRPGAPRSDGPESASPSSSADDTRARWASGRSRGGSAPSRSMAINSSPIDASCRDAIRTRHRPEPLQQDAGREHRVAEAPRRRSRPLANSSFERALST